MKFLYVVATCCSLYRDELLAKLFLTKFVSVTLCRTVAISLSGASSNVSLFVLSLLMVIWLIIWFHGFPDGLMGKRGPDRVLVRLRLGMT